MLNHYLGKQKETSKRFLNFTVPRVVPVSPQLRLVEDNESSVSLLDIYKQVSSILFRLFSNFFKICFMNISSKLETLQTHYLLWLII